MAAKSTKKAPKKAAKPSSQSVAKKAGKVLAKNVEVKHTTKVESTRKQSSRRSAGAEPGAGQSGAAPKLLSGGNPQIPKGDGVGPVHAYIAAMPGWKREIGSRLDELVMVTVPSARCAVRWNTPFYGIEGRGWFLAYHCFNKYIKLSFFNGGLLMPPPPIASKCEPVRYYHIHEGDRFDESQLASWIKQASKLPGEACF